MKYPLKYPELKEFLDSKVDQYNQKGFISNDPVCIPHLFSKKQDIEIMGFGVRCWHGDKELPLLISVKS